MHTACCTHRTIMRVSALDRYDLEASSRYPWDVSKTFQKIFEGSEVETFREKNQKIRSRHEILTLFFGFW